MKAFRLILLLCFGFLIDLHAFTIQLIDFVNHTEYNFNEFALYRTCFKNWIWADAKALAIQRSQVI
jgi:hypothetical protein